jgi:hypothetical protein
MRVTLRCSALLVFIGLLAAGCSSQVPVAPVEGTLMVKGKPLANIKVDFLPETTGPRSSGVTDSNGHFILTCEDGRPGALVGTHRVVVVDLAVWGDQPIPRGHEDEVLTKPSRLPSGYDDISKTPWKKSVGDTTNVINLEIR